MKEKGSKTKTCSNAFSSSDLAEYSSSNIISEAQKHIKHYDLGYMVHKMITKCNGKVKKSKVL